MKRRAKNHRAAGPTVPPRRTARHSRPGRLGPSLLAIALAVGSASASAHGIVGKRFFPATIATEDPFVADELALPTFSTLRSSASGEAPAGRETALSGELAKRITENFGISLGGEWLRLAPDGQPSVTGRGNVELGLKFQFHKDDARESVMSIGLGWEIGGSGSQSVGAEGFSTFTPTLYFGKGFGELPDDWASMRPFAVTGTLGVAIPSRASTTRTSLDPDSGELVSEVERNPRTVQLGLAIHYSLPYLQSSVRDVGLAEPLGRMIPLVELVLQKPLDGQDRHTTGTVNPGVLWAGRYTQVGLEAIVPINSRSGHGVGALLQLHLFLDDLFPQSIGRPLLRSTP